MKLCPEGFDHWRESYTTISLYEAWLSHAEWIKKVRPVFSEAIAQRYEAGSHVTLDEYRAATRAREVVRSASRRSPGGWRGAVYADHAIYRAIAFRG